MYSSVNNHDKSKSILSLQELLGIIAVFSFVLYLLFPKGTIEDFLEGQGNNTNLSINYLENMLLYHPDNIDLKMILMEKYTQAGKEEKALDINQKLIANTKNKKLLIELHKVDYLLNKTLYFKEENKDKNKLQVLKDKLLKYYQYTKGNRDYLFFFGESTNLDYDYLRYHSLERFMEENPEVIDYELEKIAFDLATKLEYEKEAFSYLQKLIKYPDISDELTDYLIYSLFEHKQFTKAKKVTTKLFLESQSNDTLTKFFHMALYALGKDNTRSKIEMSQLIQDYANQKALDPADIVIILNTLLELGDAKEASNFAINMFYTEPENFDETGVDLALKSLLYNSELEQARALSFFAESKFKQQKYLDKTIEISTWLGESEAVSALNKKGYHKYNPTNYEAYFLKNENLNLDYEVLGEIYKDKIRKKNYKYLDNLAKYYEYTGEIAEAEEYFTNLSQQSPEQKIAFYAIEFSYKNSHFKKGLALYKTYKTKYGINPTLHEQTIQKLLALKKFDEAYALTKALNPNALIKKRERFIDLAWLNKDYKHLSYKLWDFEKKELLTVNNLESLIFLEKQLNQNRQIDYLYQKIWKKSGKAYYLSQLLYKLLQDKKFNEFQEVKDTLTQHENNILNKDADFQILLAEYYLQTKNIPLALKSYKNIFKLKPYNIAGHQSYLWFLIDNQDEYPKLSKEITRHLSYLKKHPALQNKIGISAIVAAMTSQTYDLAELWVKRHLLQTPQHKEYRSLLKDIQNIKQDKLYKQYYAMIDEEYLESALSLKKKHLGSNLSVNELAFSYQWKLYQNIKSKLSLKHYQYKTRGAKIEKQTALELALKNTKENFFWDFHIATLKANKNFLSSSLDLGYSYHNVHVKLKSKYQNKTVLTPELEKNALENALALELQVHLNTRSSFEFMATQNDFTHLNGFNLGTAKQLRLSSNYILRSGYPNIGFNAYLSHNSFSQNIAQDFSEFGLSSSFGTIRQNTINSSWKPFGTVTLAINEQGNLGTSLSSGLSKTLKGDDSLDILLNYYNGIGVISEPIYGLNVKYRF